MILGEAPLAPAGADRERVLHQARPLHQAHGSRHLGFGYVYYALTRVYRPNHVLVIGSGHGFSPACFALGCKENGRGHVTFVDPSFKWGRDTSLPWGGAGNWDDPNAVRERFAALGIDKHVRHAKEFNYEFFPRYAQRGLPPIDLALIDGDHSYEGARYDFVETRKRARRGALILLHDVENPAEWFGLMGVKKLVNEIRAAGLPVVVLPQDFGLAIVQIP